MDVRPLRRGANLAADLIHRDAQSLPEQRRAGAGVHYSNAIRLAAMEIIPGADLDLYHGRGHILEVEVGPGAGAQVLVGIEAKRLVDPLVPKELPQEARRSVTSYEPSHLI